MLDKMIAYILTEHRGKTIGVTLGLLASILYINLGFWRTILVGLFVLAGYQIGKKLDDNTDWEFWMKDLFKPKK